ncbi:hypothetical protein ACFL40_01130 [candidate division KSB1 bacterium]
MKRLCFNRACLIVIIMIITAFLFYCTNKSPLDPLIGIDNGVNESSGSLSKLPSKKMHISSRADLQFSFMQPDYNWSMKDLTEGRSFVSLYSPKKLKNSPTEDLLPRVTIVEMVFKEEEMEDKKIGWKRTANWGANYRSRMLKEKYGEENVNIIRIEESMFKKIPCTHFTYGVTYPVSGKSTITDEYGFFQDTHYYIIQLSRTLDDVNNRTIQGSFNRFLNSLKINKTLNSRRSRRG